MRGSQYIMHKLFSIAGSLFRTKPFISTISSFVHSKKQFVLSKQQLVHNVAYSFVHRLYIAANKLKRQNVFVLTFRFGTPEGIRTPDLLVRSRKNHVPSSSFQSLLFPFNPFKISVFNGFSCNTIYERMI